MATSPGNSASTAMPLRIGTERQIPERSVRTSATKSEPGCLRAGCPDDSTRSSSLAGRREHPVGHPGAHHHGDDEEPEQPDQELRHAHQSPCGPGEHGQRHPQGRAAVEQRV